jgi:hypothetical protein
MLQIPQKLAVDIRGAAQMLSVSPRTIQNYIAARILPSRKIGRRTVVPVQALKNFLKADQPSPLSEVKDGAATEVRRGT